MQLTGLAEAVHGAGPGQSLVSKVAVAQSNLTSDNVAGACASLGAFINEVQAQTGKHVAPATATQLIAAAQNIRAGLGC